MASGVWRYYYFNELSHMIAYRFLGTSGQNISDIIKYTQFNSDDQILDIMEETLNWRHIAPTAPDTLGNVFSYSVELC